MQYRPPLYLEVGMFVKDNAGNSIEILLVKDEPDAEGRSVLGLVNRRHMRWYRENGTFSDEENDLNIIMDESNNSHSLKHKIRKKRKYLF